MFETSHFGECYWEGGEGSRVLEGFRGYCLQSVCDMMRVCPRGWTEVDRFERISNKGRGRNLVYSVCLLWETRLMVLHLTKRGKVGEGWGSPGMLK